MHPVDRHAKPPALFAGGSPAWLCGFIVVATFIAYAPAWHAGFIWDDDLYLTQNPLLIAPDGLRRIWFSLDSPSQYFPLTYTTFYIERLLWGFNSTGYHLVNILLHSANALLVWRVLARLRVPGAWLAAAIFALHPVQVESAAWVTERKNVLMGFFFLLTLLAWIKFINDQTERPWRFYFLALVLFALALCAKTTACTLPAALLLILWLKKMPIGWCRLAHVAPFMAMGMGMGLVTVWWERHHQGTHGILFEIPPVDRVLIASRALWFYAGKLLWPANLTFSYPRWTISASDPRAYGWLLATAALGVVIWRTRRPAGRSVEVATLFFATMLSPVLGFVMLYTFLYSFVADHYQYLACIGPIALAVAGIRLGLDRVSWGKAFLQPALAAALLITLGALTWQQCGMYKDEPTLWQTTLRRNPNSWMARGNLGDFLARQGQTDEAIAQFEKALEIKPDEAQTHFTLANSLLEKGSVDQAIAEFQKALEIQPDFAEAHNNLGNALLKRGKLEEAGGHFQMALQIKPDYVDARINLGYVFLQMGKLDDAITQYQEALELKPDNAQAHNNLGNTLLKKGRVDEAMVHFHAAAQISPAYATPHFNLGEALRQKGRSDDAIAEYQKALQIRPAYAEARKNLADTLLQEGRVEEAITQLEQSLQLDPGDLEALNHLAWLLATSAQDSLRNGDKAMELARKANELTGGGKNPIVLHTLAASLAEAGQFPEAMETAQLALRLADSQANIGLAGRLRLELKLYAAGTPYHSPPARTH
jgi:protein O-mannosyl-transferase